MQVEIYVRCQLAIPTTGVRMSIVPISLGEAYVTTNALDPTTVGWVVERLEFVC